MSKLNGLSLFANVGVAETYLDELGIEIKVANELEPKRAKFYSHLYPKTNMIIGDITDEEIRKAIVLESKKNNVDFIIATPPCQGMSLAGKMDKFDKRNQLIYYAIEVIKKIKPKYILLENVPQLLRTKIKVDNVIISIPEYIHKELDDYYNFADENIVSARDYDVPQEEEVPDFLKDEKDVQKIKAQDNAMLDKIDAILKENNIQKMDFSPKPEESAS